MTYRRLIPMCVLLGIMMAAALRREAPRAMPIEPAPSPWYVLSADGETMMIGGCRSVMYYDMYGSGTIYRGLVPDAGEYYKPDGFPDRLEASDNYDIVMVPRWLIWHNSLGDHGARPLDPEPMRDYHEPVVGKGRVIVVPEGREPMRWITIEAGALRVYWGGEPTSDAGWGTMTDFDPGDGR